MLFQAEPCKDVVQIEGGNFRRCFVLENRQHYGNQPADDNRVAVTLKGKNAVFKLGNQPDLRLAAFNLELFGFELFVKRFQPAAEVNQIAVFVFPVFKRKLPVLTRSDEPKAGLRKNSATIPTDN